MRCVKLKITIRCVPVPLIMWEIHTSSALTVSTIEEGFEEKQPRIKLTFYLTFRLAPAVPIPSPIPECISNDDCPFHLTCRNQKCISPCHLEDTCGRGSFCHVQNHEPVCRCPDKYQGNPLVECRPREYLEFSLMLKSGTVVLK